MTDLRLAELRFRKLHPYHSIANSPRSFMSAFDVIQIEHRIHEIWITGLVHIVDVVWGYKRRERPRALNNQTIFEHLDEDRHVLHPVAVRSVNACIHNGFVPRNTRIFRNREELAAHIQRRESAKLGAEDFRNLCYKRRYSSLQYLVLDRIVLVSCPFLLAFESLETDFAARHKTEGVSCKQKCASIVGYKGPLFKSSQMPEIQHFLCRKISRQTARFPDSSYILTNSPRIEISGIIQSAIAILEAYFPFVCLQFADFFGSQLALAIAFSNKRRARGSSQNKIA